MDKLDEGAKELLSRPIHAWLTTLRADGSPHSTVVWVDVDGDEVIFNTAVGRAKEKHMRHDPRVSIGVLDPANHYHVVSVSGRVELDEASGDAVIDRLAKKYLNADTYPYRRAEEQRVTCRLTPEQVIYNPGG